MPSFSAGVLCAYNRESPPAPAPSCKGRPTSLGNPPRQLPGRGTGFAGGGGSCGARLFDVHDDCFHIGADVGGEEAKGENPLGGEPLVPPFIVFRSGAHVVRIAINL